MAARLLTVGICCVALAAAGCGSSPAGGGGSGGSGADAGSGVDGGSGVDAGADGGVDAGTTSSECDGLGPDPGAASITIATPAEACGIAAVTDSAGNVALSSGSEPRATRTWATYDRRGARLGSLHSDSPVTPRRSGFFGLDHWSSPDPPTDANHLWTFAPDGTGPSQSVGGYLCTSALHFAAAGGVLLTGTCGGGIRIATRVVWYDDAGAPKWSTFVDAFPIAAATADSAGNVLIAAASDVVPGRPAGNLLGRWIAPNGAVAGDWFVIASGSANAAALRPRIEGGAAVMQDGKWVAVLPAMGAPLPPPDWLAARAGQDLRVVRGGKAYAFSSRLVASATPGGPAVEVVAPSGKSCGTFETRGYAATVGIDGSVIANTDGCTRSVWPGLLGAR